MTYSDIQGWFDFQDLYDEAVRRAHDGAIIVEVGCWLGKSSAYLHQSAVNSGKDIKLCYVDTWKGELNNPAHEGTVKDLGGDVFPQWKQNMIDCGADFSSARRFIWTFQMPSVEAAATFADASVDFVFIDAAHDYDSVRGDILAWLPKLKPGCIMAGHDYGYQPVKQAVDELLVVRSRDSSWEMLSMKN